METRDSYFHILPKNEALHDPTSHLPEKLKKTSHRHIS